MKKRFTRILAALALLVGLTIPMGMWGQASVGTTLWSEDFSGYEADGVPSGQITNSHTGTTVYGDATLTYACGNGGGTTKVYTSGGPSGGDGNNLLIAKGNGYFQIADIPTGGASELTVSWLVGGSGTLSVSVSTSGASISGSTITTGGASAVTIKFENTNSSKNIRVDNLVITVKTAGGGQQLTPSDLALVDAPVELEFDLYDNNTAQTISYTTSGSGNVSVDANNYVTVEVDQDDKTISVTPVAVTGTAQTITVRQAADGTYDAGSATFTVNITDSTPGADVTFTAGTDLGSTSSNNSPDQMTKGGVTVSSTDAAFATDEYRLYSGSTTTISALGYNINRIVFSGNYSSYPISRISLAEGESGTYSNGTWTGSASSISFSANGQARVSKIEIWMTADNTPTITVTPTSLESFTSFGEDPSEAQTISVSGVNLSHNITVTSVMNEIFEISLAENSGYTTTISLTQNNGTVAATTIYVRMKGGLEEDEYNGMVNIISEGAVSQIIEFTGNAVAPMTVAEAIEAIDAAGEDGIENAYVSGIVCQIDNYNSQYHSITYWISDDGEPSTMLKVFGGKGLNGANFNSENDLMVGDQVVIFGNLLDYNGTYEFNSDNYLVYYVPNPTPLIIADNLTMAYNETSGEIEYTVRNAVDGTDLEVSYDANWIYDVTVGSDKISFKASQNDTQEARTTSFILMYEGANDVYVDITQEAYTSGGASGNYEWVLADLASLTSEDVFVIVGDNGDTFAMSNDKGTGSAPTAVSVTVANDKITSTVSNNIQWTISGNATDGYTFYPNGSTSTWLYCTNNNNGVRVGTNDNKVFSYVDGGIVDGNQQAFYLKNVATSRYVGVYSSQDWRCYESINNNIKNQSFAFYKKVEAEPVTEQLTITGYGEGTGNYYLIATPFVATTPTADNGFLTDAFDLYRFDQVGDDEGKEWLNYEVQSFNLLSGHGYLYASEEDTELTFSGETYNGDGKVTLSKVSGTQFEGMNLIGNPWANNAVLKDANGNNRAYYKMNDTGSKIVAGTLGDNIAAMTGVFVSAESDGEEVTFTQSGNKSQQVCINLNSSRSATIDRAIVRFDGGDQLPKFQLFENSTKIYVTEGNKDYAVVRSAAEAEMPVSFKASENGTYTLAVETENVEMNYLHLIDNLTGMDVDLLQTPSYTFEAKTNDYTSRFRLVFKANGTNENNAETFAYFNGTNWTVSNVGDATLQVVDVTGRTVANQQINGNAELNLNQPAGVYVIRLVNGNSVKVQKVVVR